VTAARSAADEDARLLLAVQSGDGRAMARVVAVHGPAVYGFLRRMLGRDAAVDDLFQDTFLAFATHARDLDASTSLHAWLLVVAANRWRSYRRWRLVDPTRWLVLEAQPDALDTSMHHATTPEGALATKERAIHLERALAALDERDREVMLLHLDDELSASDRALALGVSEVAYRKRLERARQRFAERLRRFEGNSP